MQGAFEDVDLKNAAYYYPCISCCDEECSTYDKEGCEDFLEWFYKYNMVERCIMCRKEQQRSEQAQNIIR